ncbi:MAG: hypothetical protein EAZ58_00550 [Flavobacterium sp.]|nr:MAG: hypothetical protein EAZ58_00550 [Flavobacterium sp.]
MIKKRLQEKNKVLYNQFFKPFLKNGGFSVTPIMDDYSAYKAAANINLPTLVIHDRNDVEVPVSAGIHIHKHCKKGTLLLTNNLGHSKF